MSAEDDKLIGKQKKRKGKKRGDDDDEEELDKMLAELELEYTGNAPSKVGVPEKSSQVATEKKLKKKDAETTESSSSADGLKEGVGSSNLEDLTARKQPESSEIDEEPKKNKKKKKNADNKKEIKKDEAPDDNNEVSEEAIPKSDNKKGKKKVEADAKKDKKGPGKKALAAMQETLKKIKVWLLSFSFKYLPW